MAKLEKKIPSKATAAAKSTTKKQNEPDKIRKMKERLKEKKEKKHKDLTKKGLEDQFKPHPKKKAGTVSFKK